MTLVHIFSDNLVNANEIAKELENNKFSYSTAVYRRKGEKLIKFAIKIENRHTLEDMSILGEISLKLGL